MSKKLRIAEKDVPQTLQRFWTGFRDAMQDGGEDVLRRLWADLKARAEGKKIPPSDIPGLQLTADTIIDKFMSLTLFLDMITGQGKKMKELGVERTSDGFRFTPELLDEKALRIQNEEGGFFDTATSLPGGDTIFVIKNAKGGQQHRVYVFKLVGDKITVSNSGYPYFLVGNTGGGLPLVQDIPSDRSPVKVLDPTTGELLPDEFRIEQGIGLGPKILQKDVRGNFLQITEGDLERKVLPAGTSLKIEK